MQAAGTGRPVLYHPSGIALADHNDHPKQYRLFSKVANMWRTYKDMQPVWTEVQAIIDYWAADDPATVCTSILQ
eukprot:SAG22_NODE_1067_length_5742_cov_15.152224_5_plen_74_part_00